MSRLPDTILLGPDEEASRLWQGARDAMGRAADDLVALCEALDLGLRAVEIRVIQQLQPVKAKFPATIALQLETPDPEVDVHRDATSPPRALQFSDIVDLLSDEELACVGPRLHRGWEDRRFSCRRSRHTTHDALGVRLDAGRQHALLVLAASRNRLLREPPPVRIAPPEIIASLAELARLMDELNAA